MKLYFFSRLFFLLLFLFQGYGEAAEHSSEPQNEGLIEHEAPSSLPQEEEPSPDQWKENLEHESISFQTKFLKMLLTLGLLIAFMVLASWALKRMMKSKISQQNYLSTIKILESRSISPRTTIYLVEARNQVFIIAESPSNVASLGSYPASQHGPLEQKS